MMKQLPLSKLVVSKSRPFRKLSAKSGSSTASNSTSTLGRGSPPYVEIEGPNEAAVKSVAAKLDFDMADALYGSVDEVYKIYYDVTRNDINYCPEIKFTDTPDWLASKRRPKPLR